MFICIFDPSIFDPIVYQTMCGSTPIPPQEFGVGGSGGGACGVQFEQLQMYRELQSLMGEGYTLWEALRFLDYGEYEFLDFLEGKPEVAQETPKSVRKGTTAKIMNRQVDLSPMTKLNRMIEEFEAKLQDCTNKKGRWQ